MKRAAQKTAILIIPAVLVLSVQALAYQEDFYDDNVLRTIQLEFSQPNWWSQLQTNYQAKENIPATMIVDGVTYDGVGVRFRGNTSYMMAGQKKPFNIEVDYTHENQRLMGYKTLNLINCMNDPTFMREVLYSNMCRQQIPSAKANFVILEINGENWGIYANVQQLNAEFIEDWFPSNDGTRWRAEGMMGGWNQGGGGGGQGGGDGRDPDDGPLPEPRGAKANSKDLVLTEPGGGGGGVTSGLAALTWQGNDSAAYEAVYELKNTKQDDPWASLIHTCDVLNNTPLEQLPDEIEKVLDVDRALWLCAFEIVFLDDDGYVNKRGSDYYLYYEPETGRMHLMQYDGNECMGNQQWSLFYREDDPVVPIMYRLMDIPRYRQRYMAHARTILRSFFTEETLFPIIDTYQALIEDEVRLDNKKPSSNQAFTNGIEGLKNTIENRRRLLFSNRTLNRPEPEIIAVNQEVVQNGAEQSLTITAHIGDSVAVSEVLLYVSEGLTMRFIPQPMADDGEHGDEAASDGVFGCILPYYPAGTILRYYVEAAANDDIGTLAFNPECAEHDVYTHIATYARAEVSPVVINELMARNNTTIADPQGDYDDWIELFNTTEATIDLSGMYLSDNLENPLKWQFPESTSIGPGDYLIIWADEDGQDEPGLHANFKLSSQGETVWLFDTDAHGNMLLDSVTFGFQNLDVSFGRYPDGEGSLRVLSTPSPLGPNDEPQL
jgi:hypothetical protein